MQCAGCAARHERHAEMMLDQRRSFSGSMPSASNCASLQRSSGPCRRPRATLYPVRRNGRSVQRFAAQTGAVTGAHAFVGMGEELDVLRFRFARRATGAAEDAGGFHGREEHAFIGSVAFEHGANHLGVGRQGSGLYVHGVRVKPDSRWLHRKIDNEFRLTLNYCRSCPGCDL